LTTPTSLVSRDIGFYIFTVNGDQVTADYYAVTVPIMMGSGEVDLIAISAGGNGGKQPNTFTMRETFGYSLNGKEFLIASAGEYTAVEDSSPTTSGYVGTSAQILAGTNTNTITDANGVALTKAVNTGWAPQESGETISDVLTLLGMGSLGVVTSSGVEINTNVQETDIYVLQLTVDSTETLGNIAKGGHGLATLNPAGVWVNAVNRNAGNATEANRIKFVSGPWVPGYGLGTYGVNGATAWAVVNHQGQFAIV